MAHSPLNLALICEVVLFQAMDLKDMSLTELYQQVTHHFFKRHLQHYQRTLPKIQNAQTMAEHCALEVEALRQLAW